MILLGGIRIRNPLWEKVAFAGEIHTFFKTQPNYWKVILDVFLTISDDFAKCVYFTPEIPFPKGVCLILIPPIRLLKLEPSYTCLMGQMR